MQNMFKELWFQVMVTMVLGGAIRHRSDHRCRPHFGHEPNNGKRNR
jgi:hypothetical protein